MTRGNDEQDHTHGYLVAYVGDTLETMALRFLVLGLRNTHAARRQKTWAEPSRESCTFRSMYACTAKVHANLIPVVESGLKAKVYRSFCVLVRERVNSFAVRSPHASLALVHDPVARRFLVTSPYSDVQGRHEDVCGWGDDDIMCMRVWGGTPYRE